MISHFRMMAEYNRWANARVYGAAAALPSEAFWSDRGAFFGSIGATLNHVLVADRIWMQRFTGVGETYRTLDLILFDSMADLRVAREAEDRRIIDWIASLDAAGIAKTFTYRTIVQPKEVTQPLAPALAHFFNHQTHHRGQVHALLTAIDGRDAAPSLDLIYFQRETGIGLTA